MNSNERDNILHIEHLDALQIEDKNIFIIDEVAIIRVHSGSIVVYKNQGAVTLNCGDSFIVPELSHTKISPCSDDSSIDICRLSKHFVDKIYLIIDVKVIDVLFGSDGGLYFHFSSDNSDIDTTLTKLLSQYNDFSHPMRAQYIYSLLYCYLLEMYQEATKIKQSTLEGSSKYVSYSIDKFFMLCQRHHTTQHSTSFYADALGLSTRYLYKIVKSVTNQSPKQIINSYIMESARRLLLATTHSTLQISEKLNFPDQSSFGQFFKRNAGVSPTQFRHKY